MPNLVTSDIHTHATQRLRSKLLRQTEYTLLEGVRLYVHLQAVCVCVCVCAHVCGAQEKIMPNHRVELLRPCCTAIQLYAQISQYPCCEAGNRYALN